MDQYKDIINISKLPYQKRRKISGLNGVLDPPSLVDKN